MVLVRVIRAVVRAIRVPLRRPLEPLLWIAASLSAKDVWVGVRKPPFARHATGRPSRASPEAPSTARADTAFPPARAAIFPRRADAPLSRPARSPPPPVADPPGLAGRPIVRGRAIPGFPIVTIAEADQPPAPRRHAPRRRRAVPARRRQVAGLPGVHVRRGVHPRGRRRRRWRRRPPVFVQDRRGPGGGRGAGVHRRGCVRAGVPDAQTHRAVPHGEDDAVVDRRDAPVVAPSQQGAHREDSGEPDAHGERVVSRRRAQTQAPTRTTNRSEEG